MSDALHQRTNLSSSSKQHSQRHKDVNTNNVNGGGKKYPRKKSRRRIREQERIRQAVLAFIASFALFATVLFLCLRPRKYSHHVGNSERNERAQALRNAARGGKPGTPRKDVDGTMRYLDPRQLSPLPNEDYEPYHGKGRKGGFSGQGDDEWQSDAVEALTNGHSGPNVDYTKHNYEYPELMYEPPNDGSYPPLEPMSNIFETWGQDDLDDPPETLVEVLQHFDYQNPEQLEAAIKYRDLELPFKVYNVPEVMAANEKWTDEYVASHFDDESPADGAPQSNGACQQSVDNFFAFYRPQLWSEDLLGSSPSVDIDWTYKQWSKHAVYADTVNLPVTKKHYYWQSGVPREERLQNKKHWTFVSRDLPSFSSPDPTFFGFNPPAQKGIQCRFGERGVTAATHYDGGRNMIAMITGAKRYILSPPNACPKLGVVTSRAHPSYRHSMLNFGRIAHLDKEDSTIKMSEREKEWLKIAAGAPTLSTVLKSGEVLYVPSHWFHYIVSLQKSAQCNTRSGIHEDGNVNFGGLDTVEDCIGDEE